MYFSTTSVLLVALASILANSGQASAVPKISISSIVEGEYIYFPDTSNVMRNRNQADQWCKDQGAELAKVTTTRIYNVLRMTLSVIGTYWIDGSDRADVSRFVLDTNCTATAAIVDTDLKGANVVVPSRSCLAFVKGTNAQSTRIQSQDCTATGRVLCAWPLNECTAPTTPAPGAGDGDGDGAR